MKKYYGIIICFFITIGTMGQKKYYLTMSYGHAAQFRENYSLYYTSVYGGVMSLAGTYSWNKNFSASLESEIFSLSSSRLDEDFLQNRKVNSAAILFHLHTDYEKYFIADLSVGPMIKYHKWSLSTSERFGTVVIDNEGKRTEIPTGSIYHSKEISVGYMIQGGLFNKVAPGVYVGLQSQFQNDNWTYNTLTIDLALKLKLE